MRDQVRPFFLGFSLFSPIVYQCAEEGTGYSPEDYPIPGWEAKLEIREACGLSGMLAAGYQS